MTDTNTETVRDYRERHGDAWDRFGKYYNPNGAFGVPHLEIGNQSSPLHLEGLDSDDNEWFGVMLAAALDNLVKIESEQLISERDALRSQLATARNAASAAP